MTNISLDTIPRLIETDRMKISLLEEKDAEDIVAEIRGESWEEMFRWVPWVWNRGRDAFSDPDYYMRANQRYRREFVEGKSYYSVARMKDTGRLGPQVTLYNMNLESGRGVFGYWTPTGLTGQGLTKESGIAIVRLGHESYGLSEIWADHAEGNDASRSILLSLGFEFDHCVEGEITRPNGEKLNNYHYVRTPNSKLPSCSVDFL
jgi:RimJ/RimL family protein N-acetyltransferase